MADEPIPSDPREPPTPQSSGGASPPTSSSASKAAAEPPAPPTSAADQAAIDELLKQASFDDPSAVASEGDGDGRGVTPDTGNFDLPNSQQVMQDAQVSSIELLRDVELNVKIELGRSRMLVEDVLKLGEGSVVELDKLAGDPVDVFVNDRLVARGEVLVLNDNFCVRVNEIVAGVKDEGS